MSKRNIEFSPPDEPAFLKKLKSKINYKHNNDDVETKTRKLDREDVIHDKEEEEPVYVMEEDSRISDRELESFKTKLKTEREAVEQDNVDAKEASKQTRMIFQKPTKSKDDEKTGMKTVQGTGKKPDTKKEPERRKYVKSVKNSNLLSFGDDDEDDEDEDC